MNDLHISDKNSFKNLHAKNDWAQLFQNQGNGVYQKQISDMTEFRNSRTEVFRNLEFTGEHPCWNVICKFIEIVLQHGWRIFPDAPSFLVELNSWLKFSYDLYRPNSKAKKPISDSGIILSWITESILIWISTRVRMVDIVSYFKESITIQFSKQVSN